MSRFVPELLASDAVFLRFAGITAATIGGIFLLLGISCEIFDWEYCSVEIIPILTGVEHLPNSFLLVSMPFMLFLLGCAILLLSRLGWTIALLQAILGCIIFGLFTGLDFFLYSQSPDILLAYLLTNGLLMLLNGFLVVYFLSSEVRRLYGIGTDTAR